MDILLHSASGYHRKVTCPVMSDHHCLTLLAARPPKRFCISDDMVVFSIDLDLDLETFVPLMFLFEEEEARVIRHETF